MSDDELIRLLLVLIPGLPLAAALLAAALGPRLLKEKSHWPVILAIGTSFLLSLLLLRDVAFQSRAAATGGDGASIGVSAVYSLWTWADIGEAFGLREMVIDVTLRADPLTSIMLSMVTFVALLVAIYSRGYMHGDPGYPRFFALIGLFVFSMTMLVSVSNFLLLYVFWEAVGVCSYLLIGFWYDRPSAAAAGKKAFLVNRVGDFGFALAIFLIWTTYGTLNFHDAAEVAVFETAAPGVNEAAAGQAGSATRVSQNAPGQAAAVSGVFGQQRLATGDYAGGGVAVAICLLLMAGACGKSAQFPLHVWLPDAMEGPTPVSALIHAATMVTAGVYMVVRAAPLFFASPEGLISVAVIGGVTALLAGVIAMTQTDLKRILAYSTVSQLGFMFLALGTGSLAGMIAGMFHLFTHAFFKALLFLGAGSVMHAMGGVIDLRLFGGLRRLMPITFWTFLAGSLALAGFPLTSGFWSKDAIVAELHEAARAGGAYADVYQALYYVSLLVAMLTAIYTFRAFFLTFYGRERLPAQAGHHAHESPGSMTAPLVVLAVLALGIGWYFHQTHQFAEFLRLTPSLAVAGDQVGEFHLDIAVISGAIAVVGIAVAGFFFLGEGREAQWLARLPVMRSLYKLSHHKFYFDEIYHALFVWPLCKLAQFCYLIDREAIDALVDWLGGVPQWFGAMLRPLQNGLVQFYALVMVLGLVALVMAFWAA